MNFYPFFVGCGFLSDCGASTRKDEIMADQMRSWKIDSSYTAKNTVNPIRKIVDSLNLPCNPALKKIPLSIGDPAAFGTAIFFVFLQGFL